MQDAPNFITQVAKEVWILSPTTDSGGQMRLDGYAIVNPTSTGVPPITLQLIPYTDADRTAISQALSADTKFKVINPQGSGPDDILEFTTDTQTSRIKFTLISGGTHLNTAPGISGVGDITDQSGVAELTAPYKRPVDSRANYAYAIFITPTDRGCI